MSSGFPTGLYGQRSIAQRVSSPWLLAEVIPVPLLGMQRGYRLLMEPALMEQRVQPGGRSRPRKRCPGTGNIAREWDDSEETGIG